MAPAPTALLSSPTPSCRGPGPRRPAPPPAARPGPDHQELGSEQAHRQAGQPLAGQGGEAAQGGPQQPGQPPRPSPSAAAPTGPGPVWTADQQPRAGQQPGHDSEHRPRAAGLQQQRGHGRAGEDADALGPAGSYVGRGQLVRGPGQGGQDRPLGRAGDGDRGRGQRGQAVDERHRGLGEQGGGGRDHGGGLGQVAAEQDPLAPVAVAGDRGQGATRAAETSWTTATSPVAAAPPTW